MIKHIRLCLMLVASMVLLAACDTAEERAEAHYQKGLDLIAAGDVDRALVELRNVFQLNGEHRDARWTYAQLVEERGNRQEAFGQLLRLVEQYPDDSEARVALTRMALDVGAWDEVERHYTAAKALVPDDPMVKSANLVLDYRTALQNQDFATANSIAQNAEALARTDGELFNVRRLVVDNYLRRQELRPALAAIDEALGLRPEDRQLHDSRLQVLASLRDEPEIEAHLRKMTTLFPEDDIVHQQLVRWYVAREDLDTAEDYLRARITAENGSDESYFALIGFVNQVRGLDAARTEVDRIINTPGANATLFRASRASIDFTLGRQQEAITEMEALLEGAEPSEQTHNIRVDLARMLTTTGNQVGARALIEEVLAEDPTQVAALKLKANWLIDDDAPGDAIVELRRALDQSPDDPEVRTLLARAYERSGNRELMAEMLALAVEVSGNAPAEAMRYASVLVNRGDLVPAERTLIESLRLNPQNSDILTQLGNVYVQLESWRQVEQVIGSLNRLNTPAALDNAKELQARLLAGQNRENELIRHLTTLMDDGNLQAGASIIRLRLSQGDTAGALDYAGELLEEDPENPMLRFLEGMVLATDGQIDTAAARFRELVEETPDAENIWLALYNLHRSSGARLLASAVLEEAIAAIPSGVGLQWALATEREQDGDIDGAIAIYEALYASDSDSQIFANNLASLISSYRQDEESLERAFTIARRLRGTNVAPFQDTYGWITYLLGNHEEALSYLEPAASALPTDPVVRYHLGMVYKALGRLDEARDEFEAAFGLITEGGGQPAALPKVEAALAALDAPPAETSDN